jgi:hypothetical protein
MVLLLRKSIKSLSRVSTFLYTIGGDGFDTGGTTLTPCSWGNPSGPLTELKKPKVFFRALFSIDDIEMISTKKQNSMVSISQNVVIQFKRFGILT